MTNYNERLDEILHDLAISEAAEEAWVDAKQALLQWRDKAVVEARNKTIDGVKLMGYGSDDGTGFVLKISFADLAKLKETPNED